MPCGNWSAFISADVATQEKGAHWVAVK